MRPGRVVAATSDDGARAGSTSGRTAAEHDVEHEVLERRVQDLLDRPRHAVDLVDEENIAVLEVREDRGQIARAVEGRPLVGWNPAPIAFATICASVVLPSPGGR